MCDSDNPTTHRNGRGDYETKGDGGEDFDAAFPEVSDIEDCEG